jgi:gamma-glutamyltranspeptidase/glutathione hydrolase
MKDSKPVLTLGAVGGRRIVNTVFDVLAYRLGQSLSLAEAVKAPRIHTEGDTALSHEATWPTAVSDYLKAVGYDVKTGPGASLNAIERDSANAEVHAAAR